MKQKNRLFLILFVGIIFISYGLFYLAKTTRTPPMPLDDKTKLAIDNFITSIGIISKDIASKDLKILAINPEVKHEKLKFQEFTITVIVDKEFWKTHIDNNMNYFHYDLLLLEYASYQYKQGHIDFAKFLINKMKECCPELPVDTGNESITLTEFVKLLSNDKERAEEIITFRSNQWLHHKKKIQKVAQPNPSATNNTTDKKDGAEKSDK